MLTNAWSHLGRSGVVADIIEFQPPTLEESAAFFALLLIAALARVRSWPQLDLTELFLLGAFGWAALHERRNLVECLLVIAPPLALRLSELLASPSPGLSRKAASVGSRNGTRTSRPWRMDVRSVLARTTSGR